MEGHALEYTLLGSIFAAFMTTFVCAWLMIRAAPRLRRLTRPRNDLAARQASHTGEPLRFGGLAVLIGVCTGALVLSDLSQGTFTIFLILSSLPVLIAGVMEDAGLRVSARRRLVAAFISAALAVALLDIWVTRSDLPGLDAILAFAPVAVAMTIIVAAGFCHALNLVDGMNGLAATNIIATSCGLSVVAWAGGSEQIAMLAGLIVASTLAFLMFNWPFGKLFLGDAGSYTIGHLLVWLAMSLVVLDVSIGVGAVLLTLFWPVMDMLHSIVRRVITGVPVHSPDRLHFHQIIRRGLEIVWLGPGNRRWSNPIATLVIVPFIATPVAIGVLLHDAPIASWFMFVIFAALYSLVHSRLVPLVRFYRSKRQASRSYETVIGSRRS